MNTKFYFFSGKGGVGKTTMAASSAIYFAGIGKKTLIVTTDPASNLADVFEQEIGHKITKIKTTENLFAMELDPDVATAEYKERTLSPLRGLIPEESFMVLEEQLNSPCTAEMATFDRFTDFLQEPEYEVVIFDTAPTGHTLRLLELPVEWSGVIEKAAKEGGGETCIGPAAALAESKAKFDQAIAAMRDTSRTTFVFVLRPEVTPIYEAERSIVELLKLKITSQELIINGIYPQDVCNNPFMLARFAKQQEFLEIIKNKFSIPITLIELEAGEIKGEKSLIKMGKKLHEQALKLKDYQPVKITIDKSKFVLDSIPKVDEKIKQLLIPQNNKRRTIFFAGKGGVGKTSVAAATGLWIAEQGYKTLLLTTDPASHLSQIFEQDVNDQPALINGEKSLWACRIDPVKAVAEYKEKILVEARQKYDKQRIIAIEEELNSPCTEEMATFEKFIDFATRKDFEVIVFDTAPTGHTLRLLELPVDWSKQIEIKTFSSTGETEIDKITKSRFKEVIDMIQDINQTTFSFVMYPESTPIEEAARAMDELLTIGVPTSLVVANFILPESIITNDYLKQRKAMQEKYLVEMDRRFTAPIVELPLLVDDLIGKDKLKNAGYMLYGEK